MMFKKYLFLPSKNLPEEGWFQSCANCNAITANTVFFKIFDKVQYYIFVCPHCYKKEEHLNKKLIENIEKYFKI